MKREIKFRVWDKAKHRMLGVDQLAFGSNGELVSIYSYGPDFSNDSDALMGDKPDLNEAVLMQYTGVDDVSGKPIYEGDIVRDEDGICEQVVFSDGGFFAGDMSVWDASLGYVIGNIHENPDLLEIGYIQEEE